MNFLGKDFLGSYWYFLLTLKAYAKKHLAKAKKLFFSQISMIFRLNPIKFRKLNAPMNSIVLRIYPYQCSYKVGYIVGRMNKDYSIILSLRKSAQTLISISLNKHM
jgi:hypothetical protein